MTTMIEAALDYIKQGFKIFPVSIDKKPLTPHGLKDATQTQQGVKEFWTKYPDAGIGLCTDGLVVLDFDAKSGGLESKELIEKQYGSLPQTRIHATGGGGFHYIYKNPNGTNIRNATKLGGYPGVDLRANGGYIVAPPSHHPSGQDYYFYILAPIEVAPDWLVEMATTRPVTNDNPPLEGEPIREGQRNATLTKMAGAMRRQGMTADEIETALLLSNKRCRPEPLPESEVKTIAKSVSRYNSSNDSNSYNNGYIRDIYCPVTPDAVSERYNSVTQSVTKALAERIEDWVKETTGWFSYAELDKELGIVNELDKTNRRVVIKRLKESGKVETHTKDNKLYRYINTNFRIIDFKVGHATAPLDIKYPFGLEHYYNTYPGNIIVVGGSPDAGKTAFLLNIIRMNQDKFSIFYQSSEMGKDELQNRLGNFDGVDLAQWNFTAEERSSNFADVIRPDCVNIIDYMELSGDDFPFVAEYLRQIHDKLKGGIAIVAIQKDPNKDLPRGGIGALEKPRLVLLMDSGEG